MLAATTPRDRTGSLRLFRGWLAPIRRWSVPLMGTAGLCLLGLLVAELGPARIAAQLTGLGAVLPGVMLLTALKYPLQAAGWRLTLPPAQRPSWWNSTSATISGDSLGYLTWAGPFTGEPMRAMLIRDTVPVAAGIAAGAIERAIYNATAALLVWFVLMSVFAASHPLAVGTTIVVALVGFALMLFRNRQPARRADKALLEPGQASVGLANAAPDAAPPQNSAGTIGASGVWTSVKRLWNERRGALPGVAALCIAQHAVLVGEAYLMLRALEDAPTLRTAFVFEAVTKIVNTVGVIVPGRLGVAEGGSAVLAGALGLAASHGLSLALMRRVRAVLWAGIGLALLPIREAGARR